MMLEIINLAYEYYKREILFQNVSFSVKQGDVFSILGGNGAGKTTLMNCIVNLLKPLEGKVLLNGELISNLSARELSKKIAYVCQVQSSVYTYNVRDFVVMGRAPYLGYLERPSKEDYNIADEILEELGIGNLTNCVYTELSGGEQQLIRVARAIVQQPDVIIFDEPTNHLDFGNQFRMLSIIQKLSQKGFSVIMTSHVPDHVLFLGGQVGILDKKRGFINGKCEDIVTEENLKRIYNIDVYLEYTPRLKRKICSFGEMKFTY